MKSWSDRDRQALAARHARLFGGAVGRGGTVPCGAEQQPDTTKTAALALPTAVPAAAASAAGPSPVNGSIEFISGGRTTSIPANALEGLLLKMTPEQLDGTTVQITHDGVIHTMSAAAAKQSLLKFEATADIAAARSDVRSAIPAAEGFTRSARPTPA